MISKERIRLLPIWNITEPHPAFYDIDSKTAVGQTARLYGAMRELQEDYNKYVSEINATITAFINDVNADQEEFENQINTIMHNYIMQIDEKIKLQDSTINQAVKYMKDNLIESINAILTEMKEMGELDETVLSALSSVETSIDEINNKITTNTNNIETMKKLNNIEVGNIVKTLGYYKNNDGGGSTYLIRTQQESDIIDNGLLHLLENGLVAELIVENNTITPEQFGCYGNGINDDTIQLQRALDSGYFLNTKGIYLISSEINIDHDINMSGDSYIKSSSSLTGIAVSIMKNKQKIGRNININVNANGVSSPAIAIGKPRKCKFNLKVTNAGTIGIDMNYYKSTGNNENQFSCNVIGNSLGTTETGVLIDGFDSIFHEITTQDCKYGAKIDSGELIATSIHSWLSNEVAPILWNESSVIYNVGYYPMQVNWLYQDSVKYGVSGKAPYGHIAFFECNNTLTDSEQYTGMLNVYSNSGATRLTIDRFKNDKNEGLLLSYDIGTSPNNEFGVLNKNGVSSIKNQIQNNLPFTDTNNAPQWGGYYVLYNVLNLPASINGYFESKIVGNCVMQLFYPEDFENINKYYIRTRELNSETWSSWKKVTLT